MKKLIVMIALAFCSAFAFAKDELSGNYVDDAIAEYNDLMAQAKEYTAMAKAKGVTKAEKTEYQAEAKRLTAEATAIKKAVVDFGNMFSAIAVEKYNGVYVIPENFKERYEESTNGVVDVYNMSLQLKWPYLNKGVRTYKTSTFKGYLVCEYAEVGGKLDSAFMTIKNPNTGALHTINFEEANYWLMGKANKYIGRTEPSVYFDGADEDSPIPTKNIELHELISKLTFAGGGSCAAKTTKTVVTGCSACGEPTSKTLTSTCVKMTKMSGFVTGKMMCECPEDENWNHTCIAGSCGLLVEDGDYVRSSEASIAGKFSASYNSKASIVNVAD